MALNKVTYVDNVTIIGADNLNEIQDAIIENTASIGTLSDLTTESKTDLVSAINEAAESGGSSVPTSVRQAMLTLFESAAYAETGLTDEIAVVQSWASEVTEISLSATTLALNGDTPQTLAATTVPTGSAVVWTTSDSTIATVVGGVVTGVSNGTCRITASAGDISATCAVTVTGFAELVSISAVYTQSGTVYDTDSLDVLRSDLVVTAHYSDSSTAVITDYVLSGTLEVGTSTITVTYQGKFTTFTVTVSATNYLKDINYGDVAVTSTALQYTYTNASGKNRGALNPFFTKLPAGTYHVDLGSYSGTSSYYFSVITQAVNSTADSVDWNYTQGESKIFMTTNISLTYPKDTDGVGGWHNTSASWTFDTEVYFFMNFKIGTAGSANFTETDMANMLAQFSITKVA